MSSIIVTLHPFNEARAEATSLFVNGQVLCLNDGLRRLISSASINSVSVLKRHIFNDVKLCSADFALITMGFDDRVR